MKTLHTLAVLGGLALLLPAAHSQTSNTIVRFQITAGTNTVGNIDVELFDQDKPETVRNFLVYFASDSYTNTLLHRSIPQFVVQGGGRFIANPRSTNSFSQFFRAGNYGAITNEYSSGPVLSNVFGTIAMAKIEGEPNSATREWFFNLGDNSTNLASQNGGFTVFGRVVNSTNATSGTNLLNYFNTLSTNLGVVRAFAFDENSEVNVFPDLPVNYLGATAPKYRDLFTIHKTTILRGTRDLINPTVTVATPLLNSRNSNATLVAHGTARDNIRVERILARLNGGDLLPVTGLTNWSVTLSNLPPGLNTLSVQSLDGAGRRSANINRTFFFIVRSPLSLTLDGLGTVTGATNGQILEVSKLYTLTAKPGQGQLFSRWTGGIVTSFLPTVSFYMQTNLAITAHFFPIPPPTPLQLNITGTGTVSGPTNGQLLTYLTTYTFTARPGPGQIFAGWTGAAQAFDTTITLTRKTNATLTAKFIPNPWLVLQGPYSGLYFLPNKLDTKTAGALSLALNGQGRYTGRILYDAGTPVIQGQFNPVGASSISGVINNEGLGLALQADVTTFKETLTGTLLTIGGVSPLEMDRINLHTATNPVSEAGRYTFRIAGTNQPSNGPGGFGSGSVKVDVAGHVTLAGTLGDGTPFSQISTVTDAKNRWPLHTVLYALRGKILGWVNFNTNAPATFSGDLQWYKKTKLSDKIYRPGFSNTVTIIGSPYTPPVAATRAVNWTNGTLILTGGNLPAPITNQVTLGTNNVFTVTVGTNQLVLSITATNGLVNGSFKHPSITLPTLLKGAVLQNSNAIFGAFVGTNQSGALFIGPAN